MVEAWTRWEALCRSAGLVERAAREVFRVLVEAYGEPHRHYHDLNHVLDCLRQFDDHRQRALSPSAVELAIWMHDVVYDTHRADNESRSAELACELLARTGADRALAERVHALILATRHDADPVDADQALLVGVDLSILGQPADVFDRYESAVRREYAWVPDAEFWTRRGDLLEAFLSRPKVFHDVELASRFEAAARANLHRAIGRARALVGRVT